MTATNKGTTIINFIENKRTIVDIVAYLSMVEGMTKTEARTLVEKVMKDNDLTITKTKPMSHQLKEWYLAQGTKALELTKDDIETQAKNIGMTKGSLKYYTDMYSNASEIAKLLLASQEVTEEVTEEVTKK